MKRLASIMVLLTSVTLPIAHADRGLISIQSNYGVDETLDRFEMLVRKKEMTVFSRIDHSAGASAVGLSLAPTTLLIFGNPKIGTLLMQSQQTAAIDMPMKILCWKDRDGVVWLSYNAPEYIFSRHGITDRAAVKEKMNGVLAKLSAIATGTK